MNAAKNSGLLMVAIMTLSFSAISTAQEPGKLLPSEAMVLMVNEAMNNPELSRKDVFHDMLPRVITGNLDNHEQFYLGEVYFFALMPEEARDAYWPQRLGNSMRARIAWKRLMQIRFRAFGLYDAVAEDVVNFRKTFGADPADREYLARQTRNLGNYYRDLGQHEKVVEAVEAELAVLDYKGAYSSFLLPATYVDSYTEVGKRSVALAHLRSAKDGLTKTLNYRESAQPADDYTYPLPSDNYAFLFTPLNSNLGWEQYNDKLRQLIEKIDTAVAEIQAF